MLLTLARVRNVLQIKVLKENATHKIEGINQKKQKRKKDKKREEYVGEIARDLSQLV
jgi:hypothetical protein